MGIGGISVWQLLIVLLIVVLLFGTKKLKGMGSDLGGALKGFKSALNEEDDKEKKESGDTETREESSPDEDATARREQDDGDAPTDRDKTS